MSQFVLKLSEQTSSSKKRLCLISAAFITLLAVSITLGVVLTRPDKTASNLNSQGSTANGQQNNNTQSPNIGSSVSSTTTSIAGSSSTIIVSEASNPSITASKEPEPILASNRICTAGPLSDLSINYGSANVDSSGGIWRVSLTRAGANQPGSGATIGSSRPFLYAKITATIKAINVPGAITSFITMSTEGDEIDWEFTGSPVLPNTNVFAKVAGKTGPAQEHFQHFTTISGFDMAGTHTYTFDWKPDTLTWLIDGQVVRTLRRQDSKSALTGEEWYPTTASQISFGVWDASFHADPRTTNWAGGNIRWPASEKLTAEFSNIFVEC